jgi:multiple sugar transport system substrate-binding protein
MRVRPGTVLVLLITLLTAACNAAPKRSLPEPTPAPTEEIVIRLHREPDSPLEPMLDVLVAGFTQQYPQYKVERVSVPGTDAELYRAMDEGKIDLLPVDSWDDRLTRSSFELDTYMLKSGVKLESFGPGFEGHQVEGRTRYLPFALIPIGVMANADLLKQAGVTLPKGAWTWDEFRALASRLTWGEGEARVWGLADLPTEDMVRIWLEGQVDRPAWQATDQELKSALQFFGAMVHLDKSVQPPGVRPWEMNVANPPVEFAPFLEGKISISLGVYLDGFYDTLGLPFETEWALMPSHVGRRPASLGYIRALAIASGSKHPDAAWEFVRYASGPDGAKLLASKGVLPMYLTEEIKAAWFSRSPAPPAFTESFFATDWFFLREEEWDMGTAAADFLLLWDLNRMSNRVLAQGMDVTEAIKQFRADAVRSMERARPR